MRKKPLGSRKMKLRKYGNYEEKRTGYNFYTEDDKSLFVPNRVLKKVKRNMEIIDRNKEFNKEFPKNKVRVRTV